MDYIGVPARFYRCLEKYNGDWDKAETAWENGEGGREIIKEEKQVAEKLEKAINDKLFKRDD